MAERVIKQVPPDPPHPLGQMLARIQGTVVMRARIGKKGNVETLSAISGPDMLKQPLLKAVKQWIYRPYTLNDQAVEVDTVIVVTAIFDGMSRAIVPNPPNLVVPHP